MSTATHADVMQILGDIDDLFVERIVASGASSAEIAEALHDLENDDEPPEPRPIDASSRIAAVRTVLEDLFRDEEEKDAGTGS